MVASNQLIDALEEADSITDVKKRLELYSMISEYWIMVKNIQWFARNAFLEMNKLTTDVSIIFVIKTRLYPYLAGLLLSWVPSTVHMYILSTIHSTKTRAHYLKEKAYLFSWEIFFLNLSSHKHIHFLTDINVTCLFTQRYGKVIVTIW